MDYCTAGPQYASGGFIADSRARGTVVNGSQQQFYVRNSQLGGWSQRRLEPGLLRDDGRPGAVVPRPALHDARRPRPASREKPYLYVDASGALAGVRARPRGPTRRGTTWADGHDRRPLAAAVATSSSPRPSDSVAQDQLRAGAGQEPAAHAGRLRRRPLDRRSSGPDTVVLGLGFADADRRERRRAARRSADVPRRGHRRPD